MFSADRGPINGVLNELKETPNGGQFVSDSHIASSLFGKDKIVKNIGERGWPKAKCVHFSPSACAKFEAGGTRSRLMENYLAGKVEIKI
jgi:hypothetical protein